VQQMLAGNQNKTLYLYLFSISYGVLFGVDSNDTLRCPE
jgi:hypothetical protein